MRRDDRGQATVELALCLPLVAVVLAGTIEVGLLAGDVLRLWHAAREAARVAAVDPDPAAARSAAAHAGLQGVHVVVRPARAVRVQGRPVTVLLRYVPRGHVPLLGELTRGLEFHARATMRIEQP
jgi:Flp pilus assembly protein TadG